MTTDNLPEVIDQGNESSLNLADYQELPFPEPIITSPKYLNTCETAATLLSQGWTVTATAAKIGLHRRTVEYWLKTLHFSALLELKKAEYRESLLKKVEIAGDKPHLWQANSWILERNRVFQQEFAQPKAVAGATGNIQVNVIIGSPPTGQDGQVKVVVGDLPGGISGGIDDANE